MKMSYYEFIEGKIIVRVIKMFIDFKLLHSRVFRINLGVVIGDIA